jgi:hypothetical protein
MRKSLVYTVFFSANVLAIGSSATANDAIRYTCTNGGAERVIEVSYSTANPVPCEVTYKKDGESKSLWRYENTTGQCEAKAAEFVEKQRGWGWTCSAPNVPEMKTDPAPAAPAEAAPEAAAPSGT